MAEPASTTGAAAIGAGFTAFMLAAIGIEPQALFWSLIGSTLGLSLAPVTTRFRAVTLFAAVVFAAALLGSWLAHYYEMAWMARNGFSLIVATLFHPIFTAAVAKVPDLVSFFIDRKGSRT